MKRLGPVLGILVLLMGLDLLSGNGFGPVGGVLLWNLRLPRMLTALVAGASLALAGMQMQAVFRNPLADPHIMGVSGGAGLGAAIAALAIPAAGSVGGGIPLVAAAFAGALLTGGLVIAVSARVQSTGTLLLVGVMLGFVLSAISSILQYSAAEESLKLFYSWMAGSFSHVGAAGLRVMALALAAGLGTALFCAKGLDLLLFGEGFAASAGVSLRRLRILSMTMCALMTGAVTAYCGPLGFVGIVAPHLARRWMGTSAHRTLLLEAPVLGACLALIADILAHIGPTPLPAGSTLAIVGIPLIVILLWRHRL